MKNLRLFLLIILFFYPAKSFGEAYLYGGPKIIYYDVTQSDLDDAATQLVNLGYSTATVEANTAGVGFDLGLGFPISGSTDFEAGFAYLGEFELKGTMTGPTETFTTTSNVYSFPVSLKYKLGESDANLYLKGGMHYWRQVTNIDVANGSIDMWGTGWDPVFGIGGQLGDFIASYENYSFSGVGTGAGIAGDSGMTALSIVWKKEF